MLSNKPRAASWTAPNYWSWVPFAALVLLMIASPVHGGVTNGNNVRTSPPADGQTQSASPATIMTDKADYAPGETVVITGSGFRASETVNVQVTHADGATSGEGHEPWTVGADAAGGFVTFWVVPFDDNGGATLLATATGLTSGSVATTTFTDANTVLVITTAMADTLCPGGIGDSITICARLTAPCSGGSSAAVVNRPVIFFFNPGNCGANVGQNADDTTFTNASGDACGRLAIPSVPGPYTIRAKFRGEDKPDPCPTPGNNPCNPNDANASKRCVELSSSNACKPVTIDSAVCCDERGPVVTAPADKDVFVCSLPANICVRPFSITDPSHDIKTETTNKGTLDGDSVCYTATGAGPDTIIVSATDSCGHSDADTVIISKTVNGKPDIAFGDDFKVTQCGTEKICVPYKVSDPDGLNKLIETLVSGPATAEIDTAANQVCFTPAGSGTYTIIAKVTDSCGASDQDTINVNVNAFDPPTIDLGPDQNVFQCKAQPICITYTVSDPSGLAGAVESLVSGPSGTDMDTTQNKICFTPAAAGAFMIVAKVTNPCRQTDYDTVLVTVTLNRPPEIFGPKDTTVFICDKDTVCIGPFPEFDLDGNWDRNDVNIGWVDTPFVCIEVDTSGVYTVIVCVADKCGEKDCDTVLITVHRNHPPVCQMPNDTAIFLCKPAEVCLPVGATDPDGNFKDCKFDFKDCKFDDEKGGNVGSLQDGQWCYTPRGDETVSIYIVCEDICGARCYGSFKVKFTINKPPVCQVPNDTTITQCEPTKVYLPVSADDPDGNLNNCFVFPEYPGYISEGFWVYTPTESGKVCVRVGCIDACGGKCEKTFCVIFDINHKPDIAFGNDQTLFLCELDSICAHYTVSDPDGPRNLTETLVSGPPGAEIDTVNNKVCFKPTETGTDTIIVKVTDFCGASDQDTIKITVKLNSPPDIVFGPDQNVFQCAPQQICVPFTVTDPDPKDQPGEGGLGIGVLQGPPGAQIDVQIPAVCFTPTGSEDDTIIVIAVDHCHKTAQDTVIVHVKINHKPDIAFGDDFKVTQCGTEKICVPYKVSDPDGLNKLIETLVSGPAGAEIDTAANQVCFTPAGSGVYTIIARVIDFCGASDQDTIHIEVNAFGPPTINLGPDQNVFQCKGQPVCITYTVTDPSGLAGIIESLVSGPPGTDMDTAQNKICFTASAAGTFMIVAKATNPCRQTDYDTVLVTVKLNRPPEIFGPKDTTVYICGEDTVCIGPFPEFDLDGNWDRNTVNIGWVDTPFVCIEVDTSGVYTVIVCIFDKCGEKDCDTVLVTVHRNRPPVCHVPNDTTIYLCDPAEICLPASGTDPDGNLKGCGIIESPGSWTDGKWCYTATHDESITVNFSCIDECGARCETQFHVTFVVTPPLSCPDTRDTTIVSCHAKPVCIPLGPVGTAPPNSVIVRGLDMRLTSKGGNRIRSGNTSASAIGGGAFDKSGIETGCHLVGNPPPGFLEGNSWCYTPPNKDTAVNVVIVCSDTCGHQCRDAFTVTFDVNEPPVCSLLTQLAPPLCTPPVDFVPLYHVDPEGGPLNCHLYDGGIGELVDGGWQNPGPVPGTTVHVYISCQDTCGDSCVIAFDRSYPQRVPTICHVPDDPTIFLCESRLDSLPVYGPEGSECKLIDGPGVLRDGWWVHQPTQPGDVTVTVRCISLCDSCQNSFTVTYKFNRPPVCHLPNDTTIFQCKPTEVCLPVTATDPDGNFKNCRFDDEKGFSQGTLQDGKWCYTPTGDQTVTNYIVCEDECGARCYGSFRVTFDINDPPSISLGDDVSLPQSFPQAPICFTYTVSDPNGLAGLLESLVSSPGGTTIDTAANRICFTPSGTGTFTIIAQVIDPCGASDRDTVLVFVFATAPPNCILPNDTTVVQCSRAQLCLPVTSTSLHPPVTCVILSGPGTLSGGQWCYTPAGDEVDTVTIRCTDALGATCSGSFTVTFDISQAPVCNVPNNPTIFQCAPTQVSLPVFATGATCQIISGPGSLSGGNWEYRPSGAGTVNVHVRCRTQCDSCDASFSVTFVMNGPPTISLGPDQNVFQCALAQICVSYTISDPNGLGHSTVTKISGPGTLDVANKRICFTPTGAGTVQIIAQIADSCGLATRDTVLINVTLNSGPTCNVPRDTTILMCQQVQVCLPVSASDPDGNQTGCTVISGLGSITNGNWCYTPPDKDTVVNVTVRCSDACGLTCQKTFKVTFDKNDSPVCSVPNDTTIFQCTATGVCLPVSATDVNGNLTSCTITGGPGQLINGKWCYTPTGEQTVTVTIRCSDACGAFCEKTFHVYFNLNDPPQCQFAPDQTVNICLGQKQCFPLNAYDPDGNLMVCQLVDGLGEVHATATGYEWCLGALNSGLVQVTVQCIDSCGLMCQTYRTFTFIVDPNCVGPASVGIGRRPSVSAPAVTEAVIRPGDVDGNGQVDVADLARLMRYVYGHDAAAFNAGAKGQSGAEAADVNCDGKIDRGDVDALSNFLFDSGLEPCQNGKPLNKTPYSVPQGGGGNK
ncbi:MAG: hypothetical protein HY304_02535 [candidate division Zixibacteria bacterium]|nr:hypothetical protein [candidate division Zixibacteria bacterium]